MSLLLDALKRAEQEKLARQLGEDPVAAAPAAAAPAAVAPSTTASILELQPLARAAAASSEAQARRDAETAQKVFAAKAAAPKSSHRTTLWALAGGILLLVAAGGAYFWYSLNALAPKTSLRAAPLPPVPRAPQAANPDLAPAPLPDPIAAAPAPRTGPVSAKATAVPAKVAVVPPPLSPAAAREQLALSLVNEAARAEPAPVRLAPSSDGPRVSAGVAAGYEALRNGQLEEARQSYVAALSANPGSTDAALGLATVEARSGNASAAASLYRKALELDPRNPTALAGLASLSDFSRPDTVEMQLRTDLSRDPQSAALNVALGNLYASQGRWTEAQSAFFEAHRLEPGGPDILYNLAVSLDRMGQAKAAIPYYRRALEAARGRSTPFDPAVVSRRLSELQR